MMTRAQPRGGSARLVPGNDMDVRRQRDVMAITQMRFRLLAGRDRFQSAAPVMMSQWSPQNASRTRQAQARKVAAEESHCEWAARDGRSHIPWDCGQRQSA